MNKLAIPLFLSAIFVGERLAAAALAAEPTRADVQDVPYAKLQKALLDGGAILDRGTAYGSPSAPDTAEQRARDLKILVDKKVIDSAEAWSGSLEKGGRCKGDDVAAMLLKMGQALDPMTTDIAGAIKVLKARGVLNSVEFWEQNATKGHNCPGESVRAVVRNFARIVGS